MNTLTEETPAEPEIVVTPKVPPHSFRGIARELSTLYDFTGLENILLNNPAFCKKDFNKDHPTVVELDQMIRVLFDYRWMPWNHKSFTEAELKVVTDYLAKVKKELVAGDPGPTIMEKLASRFSIVGTVQQGVKDLRLKITKFFQDPQEVAVEKDE